MYHSLHIRALRASAYVFVTRLDALAYAIKERSKEGHVPDLGYSFPKMQSGKEEENQRLFSV